jgi:hypothetical protein
LTPVAAIQYTFIHKQYTEYRGRTHIITKKKLGSAGRSPFLWVITWHLPYNWGKKHGKTSVRVVEKCPDIQVAVVQYTFTHKQHAEQHNDTQQNTHNNKNN